MAALLQYPLHTQCRQLPQMRLELFFATLIFTLMVVRPKKLVRTHFL